MSARKFDNGKSGTKFRSQFAERRALESQGKLSTSQSDGDMVNPQTVIPDQETQVLPDPVQNIPLDPSKIILGNIVEKKYTSQLQTSTKSESRPSDSGFPQVFRLDHKQSTDNSRSLFYQSLAIKDQIHTPPTSSGNEAFVTTDESVLIKGSLASELHKQNLDLLNKMTKEDILKEKAQLETTLNADLIKFLKAKRNSAMKEKLTSKKCKLDDLKKMEVDEGLAENSKLPDNEQDIDMDCTSAPTQEEPPPEVANLIQQSTSKGWVHMDEVETAKLEWMKDVPNSDTTDPPLGESYNARFDFNGMLLPFKDPNVSIDKGLHHHGEEPERPGYSLQELLQLSRSSTQQQRCTALITLGNIMEKSRKGWYDHVLDPAPLAALDERGILLLLRFSLDDTSVAVVSATLQALRAFLYSEADEICLDRLYGWEYPDGSCQVPELLPPKTDVDDTSDLKDHELAKLDCVAAAIRTDIVLRIRYILAEMKPPLVGVTAALEILIRLSRHSQTTALNIACTPNLLEVIVRNFIPLTTDRLIAQDIQNAYGVPSVMAIRLCRVLIEYAGIPVASRLKNLKIINSLISYAGSNAGNAGLRLPIEALRLWRRLYIHGIVAESIEGSRLVLGSQLQLLLSNHDLTSSSELSCEHAAALVALSSYDATLNSVISTLLAKWSTQLASISKPTWSNTKLVAATFNVLGNISLVNTQWVTNVKFFVDLGSSSNLLSDCEPVTGRDPSSLPSLGAVADGGRIQPAVTFNSCIPFLATFFNAFSQTSKFTELATIVRNADVEKYLKRLASCEWSMQHSWYTRAELFLVTGIVRASVKFDNGSLKELILKIAIKLIATLPTDATECVKEVLRIILDSDQLAVQKLSNELNCLKIDMGNQIIALDLPFNIAEIYDEYITTVGTWDQAAMPKDWLYLPLVAAYTNYSNKFEWKDSDTTKIVVMLSLQFVMPELSHNMSCTLKFSRMALVYLCDTVYLNENVSLLLNTIMSDLIKNNYERFDFSGELPGLTSFTDLFKVMCESFCANSYGNDSFAMTLLVPLAQRHDCHYRKLLWSEHAGALRYLRLPLEKLVIPLREYLYPLETDHSLIEYYITALVRKTIRKEWSPIMYTIAMHHSAIFLRGTSNLAAKMRAGLTSIKDANLLNSLLNYTPPDVQTD